MYSAASGQCSLLCVLLTVDQRQTLRFKRKKKVLKKGKKIKNNKKKEVKRPFRPHNTRMQFCRITKSHYYASKDYS